MTPSKTLGHRLFEYGYAERIGDRANPRAVFDIATFNGKDWEHELIDLGPLPEDAAPVKMPRSGPPSFGEPYLVGQMTPELVTYYRGKDEAMALADALLGAVKMAQEIGSSRYVATGGRRQGRTFLEFVRVMLALNRDPLAKIVTSQAAWDMLARERPDLISHPAATVSEVPK
jgi:hypothetical protein